MARADPYDGRRRCRHMVAAWRAAFGSSIPTRYPRSVGRIAASHAGAGEWYFGSFPSSCDLGDCSLVDSGGFSDRSSGRLYHSAHVQRHHLMSNRRSLLGIAVTFLVLAAFALRVGSIDSQSLWRDEVDALCYAHAFPHLVLQAVNPYGTDELITGLICPSLPVSPAQSADEDMLRRLLRTLGGMIRENGPLYFFVLRGWIALTGTTGYTLRFFSLMFGVLCVPLSYVLGRRLFDPLSGLLAAAMVAVSPYLVWYSQEVKMYTLVTALALLGVYGLRRAVAEREWRWWAVQVAATSLAFYSHILAALLIPVQVLFLLTWWPQARKQLVGPIVSLALLTLPYLPLAVWQAPQVFQIRETGFHRYPLAEMAEILLNGWSTGILGRCLPWGALLMLALALVGLLGPLYRVFPSPAAARPLGGRSRAALFCWLVLPLLTVWLISLRQPLFTDRYLIWTAPAFYLLVAVGLVSIAQLGDPGRGVVVILTGTLLAISGSNLSQQAAYPVKSDFRAAAAHVADHYIPGELVIFQIPHGRYTFDYYFPRDDYIWADGLYTNHRALDGSYLMSEQSAGLSMQEMTEGYSSVWLIATETEMWDDRGLVQAWLEKHRQRVDASTFMRVSTYRYVENESGAR
jgi:mannosyltransferase